MLALAIPFATGAPGLILPCPISAPSFTRRTNMELCQNSSSQMPKWTL
jgi:hypothetical protein